MSFETTFTDQIDVRSEIRDCLKERGSSQLWLATKLGVSFGHLGNILHLRRELGVNLLSEINKVLNTNFTLEQVPPVE